MTLPKLGGMKGLDDNWGAHQNLCVWWATKADLAVVLTSAEFVGLLGPLSVNKTHSSPRNKTLVRHRTHHQVGRALPSTNRNATRAVWHRNSLLATVIDI